MYYTMAEGGAPGWFMPLVNYHWTLVANIKRDPFEQTVGFGETKSFAALGGQLGAPSTAYVYDWNILPIGQQLWEKELYSYKEFPPLQAAKTSTTSMASSRKWKSTKGMTSASLSGCSANCVCDATIGAAQKGRPHFWLPAGDISKS